jgi:hypothetical protein
VAHLPQNAANQTRISFQTHGELSNCTIKYLIASGILHKAFDTFIACERLSGEAKAEGKTAQQGGRIYRQDQNGEVDN